MEKTFELVRVQYLATPIAGWLVAQSIKYVLQLRKDGIQWRDFTASGGMPSSHAAFMWSLTSLIGWNAGWDSALFGLAAAMTLLVMYDAMDVRMATGQQTKALQELEQKLKVKLATKIHKSKGHTPLEVAAGSVVGIVIGSLAHILL